MSDDKNKIKRRECLALGVAAGAAGLSLAAVGGGAFKYLIPNVSYGNPTKFRMSLEQLKQIDQELVITEKKIVLKKTDDGKFAAISLVCTHLGCTVNRVTTGFLCPCHGSQYDNEGMVVGGPAPKALAWHILKKLPGDMIEIDTDSRVEENTYYTF